MIKNIIDWLGHDSFCGFSLSNFGTLFVFLVIAWTIAVTISSFTKKKTFFKRFFP